MTRSSSGSIVALTVHARHVPAPERQAFAERIQALPEPAVVIETCHRVEAYFMTSSEPAALAGLLELPDGGATFVDQAAIRHAMAVAVGRDSVVVCEDQVLHLGAEPGCGDPDAGLDGGGSRGHEAATSPVRSSKRRPAKRSRFA